MTREYGLSMQLVLVVAAALAGALVGGTIAAWLFQGGSLLALNLLTVIFMGVGALVGVLLIPVFLFLGGKINY